MQEDLGREHVIALVFGLLGVIQGLAFTKLAEKVPDIFNDRKFSFANLRKIVFFVVGFLIVTRVFQTYSSGIITYAQTHVQAYELYAIFITGLMQYWLFDAYKIDGQGEIQSGEILLRVMFLAVLAFVLHLLAFIQEIKFQVTTDTQPWNLYVAGGIFALCLVARWIDDKNADTIFAVTISALLIFNTYRSLEYTDFGVKPFNFEKNNK